MEVTFLLWVSHKENTNIDFSLHLPLIQNFQFHLTKCDVMELRFIHKDQGVKLTFFSDSHLAPKLFKVFAN